jgi:hypothetical protein
MIFAAPPRRPCGRPRRIRKAHRCFPRSARCRGPDGVRTTLTGRQPERRGLLVPALSPSHCSPHTFGTLKSAALALFSDLIQTSSEAGLTLNITRNDNRQIAPRLGFAWRPFGENMVVRGGYGIFYEAEGTDGRPQLQLHPVPRQRDRDRRGQPCPRARSQISGWVLRSGHRSVRSPGCRCRSRPGRAGISVEPRLRAAAVQPHGIGSRLCRHDRRSPDGGREHQSPPGDRPASRGSRAGAGEAKTKYSDAQGRPRPAPGCQGQSP